MSLYNLKAGNAKLSDLVDGARAAMGMAYATGRDIILDPANGNDANNGTVTAPVAGLAAAYALATANQHDIIWYIAGATSINLTAQLTWAKNYTHLVGICAPSGSSNRARVFQGSAATGLSPLVNITATGCIFKDVEIYQGVDDATSLIAVQVTGGRNYFHNCNFYGGGHATNAIDNCASLMLNGAEENRFYDCRFGLTTIALATGGNVIRWDGSAKENIFQDCRVAALISNAGARLMEFVDGAAVDQVNWFFNTKFVSNSVNRATTMASAFEIPALTGATALGYFDRMCGGVGFTDWDDDNRGWAFFEAGTVTAGGNTGIAQVSNST